MVSRDYTTSLAQQQLLLDERLQAQIRLARVLANDLNQTFMSMLNYVQYVREHHPPPSNPNDEQELSSLERTAQRGLSLCRQLQRFSRGNQTGPPTEIALHHAIQQRRVKWQEYVSDNYPITIQSTQEGYVLLPHQRLDELILPLLDNAVDAMPNGGPIHIKTSKLELSPQETWPRIQSGPYIGISIIDRGKGIPEELKDIALEPMTTHRPRVNHTGMGLAWVYSSLRQVSGWMQFRSQKDQGTEIQLYLPLLHQHYSSTQVVSSPSRISARQHLMLLFPSMSQNEREQLCLTLEADGHLLLEAEDSFEMLQIQRRFQEEIHVLLTEYEALPSLQVLESLKRQSPTLEIMVFRTPKDEPTPKPLQNWQFFYPHPPQYSFISEALRKRYKHDVEPLLQTDDPRR
ncbi:MAG: sensor histidine kinase [Myxococcota bacterium]